MLRFASTNNNSQTQTVKSISVGLRWERRTAQEERMKEGSRAIVLRLASPLLVSTSEALTSPSPCGGRHSRPLSSITSISFGYSSASHTLDRHHGSGVRFNRLGNEPGRVVTEIRREDGVPIGGGRRSALWRHYWCTGTHGKDSEATGSVHVQAPS